MSLWLSMIILHTIAAIICFAAGVAIISPDRAKRQPWLFGLFMGSLVGLIGFMVAATAAHWSTISSAERVIFPGLAGLGFYMLYRGLHARNLLQTRKAPATYIDDIGFTLISLFDGFIIVALIDLGAPVWLVVIGALAGVYGGHVGIVAAKRRYKNKRPFGSATNKI